MTTPIRKYTFTSRLNGRERSWVICNSPQAGSHRMPDSCGGRLIVVWDDGHVNLAFYGREVR